MRKSAVVSFTVLAMVAMTSVASAGIFGLGGCRCGRGCNTRMQKQYVNVMETKIVPSWETVWVEKEVDVCVMQRVQEEIMCTVMRPVQVEKEVTVCVPAWERVEFTVMRPRTVMVAKTIEVCVPTMIEEVVNCVRKVPVWVEREVTVMECVTEMVEEVVMRTRFVPETYCDVKQVCRRICVMECDPCTGRMCKRWTTVMECVPVMKTRCVPVCEPITITKCIKKLVPVVRTVKVCTFVDEAYPVTVRKCIMTKQPREIQVCETICEPVVCYKNVCRMVPEVRKVMVTECVPTQEKRMITKCIPIMEKRIVKVCQKVCVEKCIQVCKRVCVMVPCTPCPMVCDPCPPYSTYRPTVMAESSPIQITPPPAGVPAAPVPTSDPAKAADVQGVSFSRYEEISL